MTRPDARWMREALSLARRGEATTWPNPRVGAVVVQGRRAVGRGFHERAGEPHAEIHALREAGVRAHGATLYVTLEPCSSHGRTPPCTEAIMEARIGRVVAAMADPDPRHRGRAVDLLGAQGVALEIGCLAEEAERLNAPYLSRIRRGRPLFTVKLAASWDGRVAYRRERPGWLTAAAAVQDVHRQRARHPVLLTGVGTVLADDPALTVRCGVPVGCAPARLIIDSRLRIPVTARVLRGHQGGATWIACAEGRHDAAARRRLEVAGARVLVMRPSPEGHVDLVALAAHLGEVEQVNAVWVEAGPTLVGALLDCRLADLWVAYLAPLLIGGVAGVPAVGGAGARDETVAPRLVRTRVVPLGPDWRVEGWISYPGPGAWPPEARTEERMPRCSPG